MTQRYANPESFRQREVSVQDCQLKFLIERLIARLFVENQPLWILKGGFAMELRYRPHARTTRDVDLMVGGFSEADLPTRLELIREQLQEAAARDMGHHLEFLIAEPRKQLPGAPRGGGSFPVEALLAGRVFGRFHIDVGFGDATIGEPEELHGDDLLAFAGLAPARALAIPKVQQFSERVHA